jgi:uncharacterized protein (DUF1800 family)
MQEKLVLLWHGHFTTSAKDDRAELLMWNQNELHRRMAAGNIKDYVHKISHDPAMLDYLNNTQNRKQHPNENYARELMELFTLGIGNYTENDIKESARAFTGWTHDGDDYVFQKYAHDNDTKYFLGKSGNFNGDDIVEIIFQHPACAKYLAGKVFKWFAYDEPDAPLVESLASILRDSNWELRPLLRTILTSKAFYSEKAIGVQIKAPVQLVVGSSRLLGTTIQRQGGGFAAMSSPLNLMGQMPFYPPNVKGWPGGHLWISTSTLFLRYNTVVKMTTGEAFAPVSFSKKGPVERKGGRGGMKVDFMPTGDELRTAEEIVDKWVARLIQRPIDSEKRQVLVDSLENRPTEENVKKMVQLIVSMPEYQLC